MLPLWIPIVVCVAVFLLLVLCCVVDARRNRKLRELDADNNDWTVVVHRGAMPSPPRHPYASPRPTSRGSERVASTHARPPSGVVPVGANYDTGAALMGNTDDDDGRASLNGDEHLYADSEPPTEEEIRARNAAMARAELEEARRLNEDKLVVGALLHCAAGLRVRKDGAAVGSECAVCIEDLGVDDAYRRVPCGHDFHPTCVDPWLKKNVTCPMCNVSVVESASPLDLKAARETVERNRAVLALRSRQMRSPVRQLTAV